jgi:hypothetical protein
LRCFPLLRSHQKADTAFVGGAQAGEPAHFLGRVAFEAAAEARDDLTQSQGRLQGTTHAGD